MTTGKVVLSQYATGGNITWDGSFTNSADQTASNVAGVLDAGNLTFTANNAVKGLQVMVGSDVYSKNWNIVGSANTTSITAGDGADTLTGANEATTLVGGSGKDVFISTAGTASGKSVTLKDYTYGEDVIFGSLAAADSVANFTSNGTIKTSAAGDVAVSDSGNYYKVTMYNGTAKQNVWFGGTASATMDASAETSSLVMFGTDNDTTADLMVGGSKGDSIFGGANDSIYGGAGSDTITVSGNSVVVGLASTAGSDTVTGFGVGFSTTKGAGNSAVYLMDTSIGNASISYDKTNVTVKDGDASLAIAYTTSDFAQVLVKDSSTTARVDVAATNGAITVDSEANYADIFVGAKGSTLSFAGYTNTDGVVVDLGNTGAYGDTHFYSGIATVTGGDHDDKLIGAASTADSLVGGKGNDSLWGAGTSADTLVGGDGTNMFFYGTGDGKDVVDSFKCASDEVAFLSGGVTEITRKSGNLTLKMSTADTLTVNTDASADVDKQIKFNVDGKDYVTKIGETGVTNSFKFTEDTNCYFGSTKTDTITYAESTDENIWLDGSKGQLYSSIEAIDASDSTASLQLAGNTAANTITSGKGSASLWGGAGTASDTLVGGTGENKFYFGMGEGNDVISASNSGDKVMLYNVASSSIASASVTGGSMNIALTDGSTLKLTNYSSSSVNTFVLSDATYTYDASKKTWTKTA